MNEKEDGILAKALTSDEIQQIPDNIRKKIDGFIEDRFSELFKTTALEETAKSTLDQIREEHEKQVTELQSKIQDYEAKFEQSRQLIDELRQQLDNSREECSKLLETTKRYEIEATECRRERNNVVDERDSLLKMIERRNAEIELLQSDIQTLQNQLQTASVSKCEALAKLDEIHSKEISLNYKENRMEQERNILQNQIQSLTDELNRNINELQTIRRDNTTRILELQTKLDEKNEELKISNSTIIHLKETINELTQKAEELTQKLLSQSDESTKMMDYYKKELHAKTKLADLYKANNDDHTTQINELTSTVSELKKILNDATEQYGELETKLKSVELKYEKDLNDKLNIIQQLKDELKNANDLLKLAKDECTENAISQLAPTAAITTRLIKSDMSLTELYTLYIKATEDVQLHKKENAQLNLQIRTIIDELEEKAPIIKKMNLENQKLIQANNDLAQQIENLIQEKVDVRTEWKNAVDKSSYLERENKKLKTEIKDLARQVCHLMKELEKMRGGFVNDNDQQVLSNMSANDVISKKLVTFSDITELQENNQKLLCLVRDLSSKLEEMEEIQNNIDKASYEAKLDNYSKRLQDTQKILNEQKQALDKCLEQRDKYKNLYMEFYKKTNCGNNINDGIKNHLDQSILNDEPITGTTVAGSGMLIDGLDDEITPIVSNNSSISASEIALKNKRITELEDKVKDLQDQIKFLKEEHENYRKERMTNEKMLNEQFDSMRSEIRELTSTNCKLMSAVECSNEQIKIQQKNVSIYKKQIQTLEERNKNYENTIIKHEQTIMYLRDETMNSQQKLACTEVQLENLKQECRMLRDTETRLQLEREVLHRERQTNNLVLNNLEMIKASFERSENEGRQRVEQRLDEAQRECSALRRRLQEEQENFRELADDLKRQTNTAKERMENEIKIAEQLRSEVANLRDELINKSKQIDNLSKKLQESLTPQNDDNPITQANKKAKEYELKYEKSLIEIDSLKKDLELSREHSQQLLKVSQSTEKELADINNIYTEYREKTDNEIKQLKQNELNLKSRIDELETEIQLQLIGTQQSSGQTTIQIDKIKIDLKQSLEKLNDSQREIRQLREQLQQTQINLQNCEQKYANEMQLHSNDLQELSKTKEEIQNIREKIDEYRLERDRANNILEETKKGWSEFENKLKYEKDELEKRLIDLNAQNESLHNQIEALSTKLSLTKFEFGGSSSNITGTADESMNDSTNTMNNSLTNRSITEEESRNDNQLLQIIKYLRKEKDIAIAKVDILKSENARLISEQNILQKKINEYHDSLNNERTKSESVIVTAAKHEEILRKVETLNAITDSNRILREERDTLSKRLQELTERISKTEDELFPLQEKNRELLIKIEEVSTENTSLRTEAVRWRQRANLLIERQNKNPEDFKRLQNERESLAKLLSAEKESLKQCQDELQNVKNEKLRLENEITNLGRQIQGITDDKKKITDEYNSLKQQNSRMAHEIMELKNQLLQREEDLRKVSEDLASKDALLADSENKVVQIRKIAKRYKDSFFELKNRETDISDNPSGATSGEGDTTQASGEPGPSTKQLQESEKELKDKINELNSQIQLIKDECERLRQENELLKELKDKEERNKILLKEAKTRIVNLTNAKDQVSQELTQTKNKLQNMEQNRDEHDILINNIKAQFESRIARLKEEHTEQEKEMKETIARLTRENETLLMRINQLHRQLGMQQSSKPSTSSGSGSDKGAPETPRTANVKPMSGPSGQQSATVTPWRGSDTPLASIRPMSVQNSRTAAVLPTSQTSTMAAIQGSSSGSVTALVPPQQQVHTTGNSSGEAMSSSPTSSHTDYMPATSSAAVVVAAVPPMGASAESSQEAESIPSQNNESSSSQIIVSGGQQQQAVALVSPRVEGAQSIVPPSSIVPQQSQETNQPSTSGTSSSSNISVSSHHQASSSNTVTTTQAAAGHKRQRDVEGDSSTGNEEQSEKPQPQNKRKRIQAGEVAVCQGVSESGIEVEYQVPTSSQRDQEDDVIVVDSEEDDGMPDEGHADADDGPMEDEVDNGGYEIEESYEQEQDIDEGEGPDIDEDNVQSDNNEVDVDDSSEVPNQSGAASSVNQIAPDAGTSGQCGVDQSSSGNQTTETQNQESSQQIQTISSGSDAGGASPSQVTTQSTTSWRQTPLSRQQQATLLMLQQGYEETGDDSIVPSTPTLYVPRRGGDGFSEAVSSPHPQVPHAARFTFSDSSRQGMTPNEGVMDDSRTDLSVEEVAGSRSVPSTPQRTSPQRAGETSSSAVAVVGEGTSSSTTTEKSDQTSTSSSITPSSSPGEVQEVIAGPSNSASATVVAVEGSVPEITVTTANEEDADLTGEGASTSDVHDGDQSQIEEGDIEEEGLDGVTSEGEKANAGTDESNEMEEGREAEASTTPSINTRSRTMRGTPAPRRNTNRNSAHSRSGRPTPIIWQDPSSRGGGGGGRNMPTNLRTQNVPSGGGNVEPGSPSRGSFQMQRGQRARRMRRPQAPNFGANIRY